MLLYRRSRKRYREGAHPDTDIGSGDMLTHGLRSYLAKSRKQYLAQRQAFLRRNVESSIVPIVMVRAPESPTNSHGSHMRQLDTCDTASHVRHIQTPDAVVANVPETWSEAHYPDHPAFASTRSHSIEYEEHREPRSFELHRTQRSPFPSSTTSPISSLPNIPPPNRRLNQGRHQDKHRSSGSEWSMTTTSTTDIQDHKEFWDRSMSHSPSTIPELGTENGDRLQPEVYRPTSFELE